MVEIENTTEEKFYLIRIKGDVDASSSIHLDDAINKAVDEGHKRIIIDGRALNYISSAGLGVFISHITDFKNRQIQLVLFGLSEKVQSVFEILGLHKLLKITTNKEQAKKLADEV